ncbi:phosphoglycerate dehydrogenase [Candidatus Leptofilum sp.]|uniref:phosphoglycerate dehydrogenase n=1 Tax=Candidatus Leptofilum sp. TaxID=3241576 RepID=UPI003B5B9FB9
MKPLSECHVLVTPTSYGRFNPTLKSDLETAVQRVTYNRSSKPLTSAQLQELLPEVDGYIAGLDEIDAAAIAAAPNLQVIARYGVGTNNVDLEAAKAHNVTVTNTPGANAASVAELTITLMLNLLRPIETAVTETRQGGWPRLKGLSLVGKTVGIIGLGAIGKAVAQRLAGFECRLLAFDVATDDAYAQQMGVTLCSQARLLAEADVVTLHLPVLPATEQMVNDAFLQQMKPGSYLINTSRGELVDEVVLLAALENGRLAGAALDAFQQEPPGAEHPLLALPNVIPTPHMGAHSDGATNGMGSMALADCLAVLAGKEPAYPVI